MLNSCYFGTQHILFSTNPDNTKNRFSIVVGKNGTGKSRLLSALARAHLEYPPDYRPFVVDPLQRLKPEPIEISCQYKPSKVIAVSTSPFDKFPILRSSSEIPNYLYLGLRGLRSLDLGNAFMSQILSDLIKSIAKDSRQGQIVSDVLRYLGYEPTLNARLFLEVGPMAIEGLIRKEGFDEFLSNSSSRYPHRMRGFQLAVANLAERDEVAARQLFLKVQEALESFTSSSYSQRTELVLSNFGIQEKYGRFVGDEYGVLLEWGLLRLRDVTLQKLNHSSPFRIQQASSGEQCVVMTFLGIASQIQDNSLICIDEPEVCLHPEWQERYMEQLVSTFSHFNGCHFVVATHSPQIVANVASENCWVVDLESNHTYAAANFARRSADFQLATLFGAPGFKNEYLSREVISILAELSRVVAPEVETLEHARRLLRIQTQLRDSDPVKKLMVMLDAAVKEIDG